MVADIENQANVPFIFMPALSFFQKGVDTRPVSKMAVQIIGMVNMDDLAHMNTSLKTG